MKILIIEDDSLVTEILAEYLEDAGYGYECAGNGREGIEKLHQQGEFDVILLDRMMPEMDGMTFMSRIREDTRFSRIPVIMQTAAGSVPEVIEGSRTGVFYYIVKPYSEELLLSVVRAAAAQAKGLTGMAANNA